MLGIVGRLSELPVHVHLAADLAGFVYPRRSISTLADVYMLNVAYKPLSGWKQVDVPLR